MKYGVKYRTSEGLDKVKQITADSKKEAMERFNELSRRMNVEIKEVKELDNSLIVYDKTTYMLDKTNDILFEQLQKFKDINTNNKEEALMQISKNNSLAGTAKVLVQSISLKTLIENSKEKM